MAPALEPAARRVGGLTMLGVGNGGSESEALRTPAEGSRPAGAVSGMPRPDRDAIAVLLSVTGLGPLTLGRLVAIAGSPAAILEMASSPTAVRQLVDASRTRDGSARAMPESVAAGIVAAAGRAPAILREVERLGIRVVALGDVD